jgi:glycosyltransferase involved in cell wall biosynthesis
MRIVHIGVDLETNTTNGVNRVVSLIARAERELGHDVTLVRIGGHYADCVDPETGIRALTLPTPRTKLGVSPEVVAALEANALGADVFHFHSVFMPEHNLAARHAGAPYVVSPHGAYHPRALERSRWRKLAYRRLLDQRYLDDAAFVHALTEEEAGIVRSYARPKRVEVIPNPVAPVEPITDAERKQAREALGISDDTLVPIYIGRLDPEQKGLDLLIEAVRELARRRPVRLLLAGPPAGQPIAELLQPGDPVTVLPPAFGDEKRRLLAAADVFASPSRWEGQPAAVLEALAHGLPVLISEAAGLTDFVRRQRGGEVAASACEPVATALESQVVACANEPKRLALAEATQLAFGPRTIAKRFIDAYESAPSDPDRMHKDDSIHWFAGS